MDWLWVILGFSPKQAYVVTSYNPCEYGFKWVSISIPFLCKYNNEPKCKCWNGAISNVSKLWHVDVVRKSHNKMQVDW